MKKIVSLALLALSFLISAPAYADEPLKFGVKAGLNVSDFRFNSDVFDKSNQVGWFIGPTVKFTLPVVGLGMNMRSTYALKNSNFSVNLGFGVTAFKHLQVSANYNIACGKTGDATWKTATDAATSVFEKKGSRNSSWQLGLAYFF